MKKSIMLFLIGITIISSISFYACSKDDDSKKTDEKVSLVQNYSKNEILKIIKTYHENVNSKEANPIDKIIKWIKAHIGTHLSDNCNGSMPCGPCPGICLKLSTNSTVVEKGYSLSNGEFENGERLFVLTMLDETNFLVNFIDTQDFVYKDEFVFQQDLDLGSDLAKAFGKESFIVKKGNYPVICDFDPKGETVITILK